MDALLLQSFDLSCVHEYAELVIIMSTKSFVLYYYITDYLNRQGFEFIYFMTMDQFFLSPRVAVKDEMNDFNHSTSASMSCQEKERLLNFFIS